MEVGTIHSGFPNPMLRASSPLGAESNPPGAAQAEHIADAVEISRPDAAEAGAQKSSGSTLAKLGLGVALAAAAVATTGCVATMPYQTPYGYGQTTVGVTPDGTVYTQDVQHGPHGTHVETEMVGPWGYQYGHQDYGNGHGHNGHGHHNNGGHIHNYPTYPNSPTHPWLSPW